MTANSHVFVMLPIVSSLTARSLPHLFLDAHLSIYLLTCSCTAVFLKLELVLITRSHPLDVHLLWIFVFVLC